MLYAEISWGDGLSQTLSLSWGAVSPQTATTYIVSGNTPIFVNHPRFEQEQEWRRIRGCFLRMGPLARSSVEIEAIGAFEALARDTWNDYVFGLAFGLASEDEPAVPLPDPPARAPRRSRSIRLRGSRLGIRNYRRQS
jgi:hypothetical protein